MSLFRRLLRRRPVPPAVAAVRLPQGQRRTAWATTAGGAPVVATDAGLLLPEREELLLWRAVEKAVWDRPLLRVREASETAGGGREHVLELDDEGDLPEVVRDRVTSSVAWSQYARIAETGGVRVVGRRVPGQDLLEWQVVFDAGLDPQDPGLRARADQVLAGARRAVG